MIQVQVIVIIPEFNYYNPDAYNMFTSARETQIAKLLAEMTISLLQ